MGLEQDRAVVIDHLVRARSESSRMEGPRRQATEPSEVLAALTRLGQPHATQVLNSMSTQLVALAALVRTSVVPVHRLVEAVVALHLADDRQDDPRWVKHLERAASGENVQCRQARLVRWRSIGRATHEASLRTSVLAAHRAREQEREQWREWFARHQVPPL